MVVAANRDASKECILRATEAINAKDVAKARRLLLKASKLDPSFDAEAFLKGKGITTEPENGSPNERSYSHDDHYEDPSGLRNRRSHFGNNFSASAESNESHHHSRSSAADAPKRSRSRSKSATQSQAQESSEESSSFHVTRIRHCKDYYEILQVSRDCNESVLKRKYRELALKLHPDKCNAPGATEAFKALGNAYSVLSDPQKRESYDRRGSEEVSHARRSQRGFYDYDVNRGFESEYFQDILKPFSAEMTPEEIFEMFFGGGFPGGTVYRRGGRHYHRAEESPLASILQLLPLFVLLFGAMFVQLLAGEPAFSLRAEGSFNVQRFTKDLKVPYYVKSDFLSKYSDRIYQVDVQVEEEFISRLRVNCYREKNQKESAIWRAKMTGDSNLYGQAQRMEMPNCKRLEEIYH